MSYLLITGSRDWVNKDKIRSAIWDILDIDSSIILVHGGCPTGADQIASEVAEELEIPVIEVPADWATYGRSAGPIRNQEMIDKYPPKYALAFPLPQSKGTIDCIRRIQAYDKCVIFKVFG